MVYRIFLIINFLYYYYERIKQFLSAAELHIPRLVSKYYIIFVQLYDVKYNILHCNRLRVFVCSLIIYILYLFVVLSSAKEIMFLFLMYAVIVPAFVSPRVRYANRCFFNSPGYWEKNQPIFVINNRNYIKTTREIFSILFVCLKG